METHLDLFTLVNATIQLSVSNETETNTVFELYYSYWRDKDMQEGTEGTIQLAAGLPAKLPLPLDAWHSLELRAPGYQSLRHHEKLVIDKVPYTLELTTRRLPDVSFEDAMEVMRSLFHNQAPSEGERPLYGSDLHPGFLHNFPGIDMGFSAALYEAHYTYTHRPKKQPQNNRPRGVFFS
jgi:hypothetical protein